MQAQLEYIYEFMEEVFVMIEQENLQSQYLSNSFDNSLSQLNETRMSLENNGYRLKRLEIKEELLDYYYDNLCY